MIALCLLFVAALGSNLPRLHFETSTESFLHADDPILLAYNAFRDQFGRDELILVSLRPERVFDLEFLAMLRDLHERFEQEVPHLDEVTSLVNARATRGAEGRLIVEDLMARWPESQAALDAIEAYAVGNPSYENLLISEDGRLTTVTIRTSPYSDSMNEVDLDAGFDSNIDTSAETDPVYLTNEENTQVVEAVEAIVADYRDRGVEILVAGSPVVTQAIKASMQRDMLLFMRLTLVAIGVLLYILFRRISAVLLSLAVVAMSLVATVGLMAATGTSLKLPTMILPTFLLAVGIGDSVHILTLFYRQFDAGATKAEAITYALEHSGLPVTLTSLTTAGGLLSFAPAALTPISDLGVFAPAGVMLAWLFSLLLLPALICALPLKTRPLPQAADPADPYRPRDPLDRILAHCAAFSADRHRAIVGVSAAILALCLLLASWIRFAHNPLEWLPEGSQARAATERIDQQMRGSISLEAVLTREGENAWYDPVALQQLDDISSEVESLEHGEISIGKSFSALNVLKEIHRALNENREDFYSVPDARDLIAQEFLLFENSGSDDLENLVDSQFTKLRLSMKAPFVDAVQYSDTIVSIEKRLDATFGPDTDVELTGLIPLLFRTMTAVNITMSRSYGIAFVIIAVLMMLMLGSPKLGLVAMIPNLLPIAMAMALMGLFNMPLDTFTLMIASISLGLAVDDTIHFMHNYRRYHAEGGDSREAIRKTLATTGRAMLFTTLALACGFLIFAFSSMNNVFNFGVLTSFAITMALLADILLAPALMHWIHDTRHPG